MAGSLEIRMPCHKAWLVITDERVSLMRRSWLRRKPCWTIQRAAVAGVNLRRTLAGSIVLLRTRAGKDLPVTGLHPSDALRLVKLLGYAPALLSPSLDRAEHGDRVSRMRCKGGRIDVSREAIAFVPAIGVRRAVPWWIGRDRIAGVACLRLPGPRMLHDLELHALDGRTLRIERVHPDTALRLLRLLGYVPGTLPAQPAAQREALELHFFSGDSDETAEGKLTVQTGRHTARRRAVLRDLDELWKQQQSASIA